MTMKPFPLTDTNAVKWIERRIAEIFMARIAEDLKRQIDALQWGRTAKGLVMGAKLNELDKIEWRDVVRRVRPDWSDEQFEIAWAAFQQEKRAKRLQ